MNVIADGLNQIRTAQGTPFRKTYHIAPNAPRALSDEEIAMARYISREGNFGCTIVDEDDGFCTDEIKEVLPDELHERYDKLHADPRFERFVLFAKNYFGGVATDGMLVGFGKDDFYYVLVVWDVEGQDVWDPAPGDESTPLVAYD